MNQTFLSDIPEILREALSAVEARQAPVAWRDARARVAADRAAFETVLDRDPSLRVYGVTTLSGHRDDDPEPPGPHTVNALLWQAHLLGDGPRFDTFEALCITAAKILQTGAGGSLISPETYDVILAAFEDPRCTFDGVPRLASYSSGDVVPGMHWARAALKGRLGPVDLAPGEAMALMNGSFVHVGAALALTPRLARGVDGFLEATARAFHRLSAPQHLLAHSAASADARLARWAQATEEAAPDAGLETTPQPPVSLRATDGVAMALMQARREFDAAVANALAAPSNNPLIARTQSGEARLLSQGSFLALPLALATETVINALLAAMWTVTERVKYMLSGRAPDIPLDGGDARDPIRFIQAPKMVQAILERSRRRFGMRAFATGGATSYGVEDFWTHGLGLANDLSALLDDMRAALAIEAEVIAGAPHAMP